MLFFIAKLQNLLIAARISVVRAFVNVVLYKRTIIIMTYTTHDPNTITDPLMLNELPDGPHRDAECPSQKQR